MRVCLCVSRILLPRCSCGASGGFASPESIGPALFGRVVLTGGADGEGDTQGLSQGQPEALQKAASGLAVDASLATVPVSRVQREFQ